MSGFELPELPFARNALEPVITARTLEFHYDRHHRTYVDKLNELAPDSARDETALVELVRTAKGALFNNAAQTWNHTFYWMSMAPSGTRAPGDRVRDELARSFGSVDAFKREFAAAAVGQFGSGWAWLVREPGGKLAVTSTSDADNPMRSGCVPLVTLDVWEHAYYLDYQNQRARYVEAWLEHLLNWQLIDDRLSLTAD